MLVAFDIDGTIDAEPATMLSLMQALRMAGHRVVVVTGSGATDVTPQDTLDKTNYLAELGCANCYDQLVVLADPADDNKAEWLEANRADLLVDNSKDNAKAAAAICPVLILWRNRI